MAIRQIHGVRKARTKSTATLKIAVPGSNRVCTASHMEVPSRLSDSLLVSLQALVDRLRAVGRTPLDIATVPHMGGRPMDRGGLLAVDGAAERVVGGWITRAASAPEMTQG